MNKLSFNGPVVLAIMDGIGLAPDGPGNAVAKAHTDFLTNAIKNHKHIAIEASGEAVGLLKDTMGNSEVGHNTIGCGQIFKNGIAHIEDAFETGAIWKSEVWQQVVEQAKDSTLHFAGIFSDGRVHSDISELERMIEKAYDAGVRRFRVHAVFDGRDVAPQSEPKYINRFEEFAKKFEDADIKIASGGGRMTTIADRYENDWGMVERGWNMMVHGISNQHFHSATEAIEYFRAEDPEIQDQYLPDFIIVDDNDKPVGKVEKGDAFIYFDFRADRAVEIASAFANRDFSAFNRGNTYLPDDIYFAGLTEYDSDKHIPEHQLIAPDYIKNTLNEYLEEEKVRQLAISETVKFGHITYYFNGNSYEKLPREEHIEIPSEDIPFNEHPWMKSAEIVETIIKRLDEEDPPQFIRLNFPNGDMVGHFADLEATIASIECMDIALKRLAKKIDELGGVMLITADHGNAEELFDENGEPKTAHTTNKVPFIIYDNTENKDFYKLANLEHPGLSNIAATIATMLGRDNYPDTWQKPLIVLK